MSHSDTGRTTGAALLATVLALALLVTPARAQEPAATNSPHVAAINAVSCTLTAQKPTLHYVGPRDVYARAHASITCSEHGTIYIRAELLRGSTRVVEGDKTVVGRSTSVPWPYVEKNILTTGCNNYRSEAAATWSDAGYTGWGTHGIRSASVTLCG